jgi:hypothetical protein
MDSMEFRVLGPDGPAEEFAGHVKTLLGLDATAWETVAEMVLDDGFFRR